MFEEKIEGSKERKKIGSQKIIESDDYSVAPVVRDELRRYHPT